MKYYVLYNPKAGHGRGEDAVNKAVSLLDAEYEKIDITAIDSYAPFFERLCSDDKIVLCGGDGTINRFANDTDGINIENEVFYFATGTGNDFLHDIDGANNEELLPLNKYIENLPTVEVKGKTYRFVNGVGFGIDGYCCEVGDIEREKSDKPVNYTAIAIKGLLFRFKPRAATVTVDGVEYKYKKVWIAPTMNGRFYGGGMMPTPNQNRLDKQNKLSLMLFHDTGKIKTLMIFPSLFKGEHVKHTEAVTIHTGREITVKFDRPTPLQIDGETILDVTEYTAKCAVYAKV